MTEDKAEWCTQGVALAVTLGLGAIIASRDPAMPQPALDAPKPAQVTLSVVEEPPPPPLAPPPPAPESPPPPPQVAPSLLPPPPPPRPRHVVRPKNPPPLRRTTQESPPLPTPQQQSDAPPRPAQPAPENHSAEGAYVYRLHAIIQRNTRPPDTAAYRLSHPSGEVLVAFTLSRSGAVSGVHVLRSSGHAVIDEQGRLIVVQSRYPAMPPDVFPGEDAHDFQIPVAITSGVGDGDTL